MFIPSHPLAQDLPRTPGHVPAEEPPAHGGDRSGEQQGHHRPREEKLKLPEPGFSITKTT